MQLPKSEQLNIASLSRLFDNKAECYKLFWFQAILNHVCKGQQEISFEELIDDMIANAWYMVTEYHLNLGPRDKLEEAVNYISSVTAMLPNVKQQEIRNWLQSSTDSAVTRYKRTLTLECSLPFAGAVSGQFPRRHLELRGKGAGRAHQPAGSADVLFHGV